MPLSQDHLNQQRAQLSQPRLSHLGGKYGDAPAEAPAVASFASTEEPHPALTMLNVGKIKMQFDKLKVHDQAPELSVGEKLQLALASSVSTSVQSVIQGLDALGELSKRVSESPMKKGANWKVRNRNDLEFDRLIDDDDGLDAMIDFARKEFSEENLIFLKDVRAFASTSLELEPAVAQKRGADIIDTYLCAEAEMRVNLPSALYAPFAKRSTKGDYEYTPSMFAAQVADIKKMVERDTFRRFKASEDDADALVARLSVRAPCSSLLSVQPEGRATGEGTPGRLPAVWGLARPLTTTVDRLPAEVATWQCAKLREAREAFAAMQEQKRTDSQGEASFHFDLGDGTTVDVEFAFVGDGRDIIVCKKVRNFPATLVQ
eukprot:7383582-Prymnesium_polylepis.1